MLVVAIDMCTGLTVVFLVEQIVTFHDAFAEALGFALEDLGVSHEPILLETTAVKTLPLRPFADAGVQENLETIDFMCGIELSYADDLRIVQRRLNDFPRDLPPHYVPAVAVQSLFAPGRAIRQEP